MDQRQRTLDREKSKSVLYGAFELVNGTWKMVCSDGSSLRHITVTAGDLAQVQATIIRARQHFGMDDQVHIVSCSEAGATVFGCIGTCTPAG